MEGKNSLGRVHSIVILSIIYLSATALAVDDDSPQEQRQLSFFNVVKFPNIVCKGNSNKNGTCYTAEECSDRGGVSSGSCADGFGVCCVITLECGKTSSDNVTHLVQDTTTSPTTNPCKYTICPMNKNICRIKYDMITFELASPMRPTLTTDTTTDGGATGDCTRDTFAVSGGGASFKGSPTICGTNTGQHVFVDTDGVGCSMASFVFGGGSDTRQYDIKVYQYECTQEDLGGPMGCLQYHTGNMGTIASFNYPIGQTTVSTTTTATAPHLSNQDYSICFRRSKSKCALCFTPTLPATNPLSFGLSVSASTTAAQGQAGTNCATDFLQIPAAITKTIAVDQLRSTTSTLTAATANFNKFCGRFFSITQGGTASVTMCTGIVPFRVRFVTDDTEAAGKSGTPPTVNGAANEAKGPTPYGTIGFSLTYFQADC